MSGVQPGKSAETVSTVATGLATSLRITTMNVTDVATPIPAASLTSRVTLKITNLDGTEVLYIGNSNVTADRVLGTTAGDEIGPDESFNGDIDASLIIYGRAAAGKTILIKVLEIA